MQVSNNENVKWIYRLLLLLCIILSCNKVSFAQQDVDEENPSEAQKKAWKHEEKLAKDKEENKKTRFKKDKESSESKKLANKERNKHEAIKRKKSKKTSNYQGERRVIYEENEENYRRITQKINANFDYSLDPESISLKDQKKTRHKNDKENANYNGDNTAKNLNEIKKKIHQKDKEIKEFDNKELHKDLNTVKKTMRKKDNEIAKSEGTISVKQVNDGLNTSKVYKVVADGSEHSYKKQQRIRKRIMKKHTRKQESENKPTAKKGKAPKYDSAEKFIWND